MGAPASVATGDFAVAGQDEIVMAWVGGSEWVNLKGSIHPAAELKHCDEQLGNGNVDVATARLVWDSDWQLGAHDIWVGVDHLARDEDLYEDTWAHVRLDLAPCRQYLPLVRTGPRSV